MAGRREVAWLVGWWSGGAAMHACWLESGVELLGVWPWVRLSMVGGLSLA